MPASIATLTDLLGRIERGTGADRELWCDLLLALLDPQGEGDKATRLGRLLMAKGTPMADGTACHEAAKTLIWCEFPRSYVRMSMQGNPSVINYEMTDGPDHKARSLGIGSRQDDDLARAALAALLKAKIAEASDADAARAALQQGESKP